MNEEPLRWTGADIDLIVNATEQHFIEPGRPDADGNSPCSCNHWSDSPVDVSWDQHMAEVALVALAEAGRLAP